MGSVAKAGVGAAGITGMLLATLGLVMLAGCSSGTTTSNPAMDVLEGSGSYTSQVSSKTETLPPAGVVLNTRIGTSVWTGLITGPADVNVHALRNPNPPESVNWGTFTFKEAVIGQRRGGLVLEMKVTSQGDVNVAPGTHSVWQFTVLSGSGDFEGVSGHGLAIGGTHLTSTFLTYWMQIQVPKK